MWTVVNAKIKDLPEREPRVLYHGTSAGAIELATRGGPPYELVSLGALVDKGVVPLGGEITRGGFSIRGINQDRISSAESMERPLSYALGDHETRSSSPKTYTTNQSNLILKMIDEMNKQAKETSPSGNPIWPVKGLGLYRRVLEFTFAMMRLRQMTPRAQFILRNKMRASIKRGRLTYIPPYPVILEWIREVVRAILIPYQNLLEASRMTIEQVIERFPGRMPASVTLATDMGFHYKELRKFIEELQTVPGNKLLLYAISLEEGEAKERMIEQVQQQIDRLTPRVDRLIRLAERAVNFDEDVPLHTQEFPFDLMDIPVIIRFVATQYTVNPGEIAVFETVDLDDVENTTIYYFAKHETLLRNQSSWLSQGLYHTEHLRLQVGDVEEEEEETTTLYW